MNDVRRESVVVHGYKRSYAVAGPPLGTAPVLWMIHGIGDCSRTWDPVLPHLDGMTVICPDLLGHGDSDKPRADYSVGGFANGMRDLQTVLGVERATVVGHSLGGGVAMQFAYQYPERVERLVLVSSGGLGAEVNPLLRASALPGAHTAIGISARPFLRKPFVALGRRLARLGLLDSHDVEDVAVIWKGLGEPATRKAFLRTLRAVIDVRGQSVTGHDRLYLARHCPVLLVWGDKDPIVPVSHVGMAALSLPHAKVAIVPRSGHMPHRTSPALFARALQSFVDSTAPADHDGVEWRDLLVQGRSSQPVVSVTKSMSISTDLSRSTSRSA
jgi:pimeloyl-ACP methyl ester carboxylesterase